MSAESSVWVIKERILRRKISSGREVAAEYTDLKMTKHDIEQRARLRR
jgi:hypothetical protein